MTNMMQGTWIISMILRNNIQTIITRISCGVFGLLFLILLYIENSNNVLILVSQQLFGISCIISEVLRNRAYITSIILLIWAILVYLGSSFIVYIWKFKGKSKKKIFSNNYVNDDNNCPICLEEFGDNTKILECAHKYHISCIDEWLNEHNNCPICRNNTSMS